MKTFFGRLTHNTALLGGLLGAVSMAGLASAQLFEPVSGTEMVQVPQIGSSVPREIIWSADGSRMVLIPGGSYKIGVDDPVEKGFTRDEGPAVTVTLDPYYIDVNETSYEQYMKIVQSAGLTVPRATEGLLATGKPIVAITFESADKYAKVMRKELPTEAEWEVAARGPQANLYPWGNEPKPGAAVVGTRSSTAKVGASEADVSAFGVHDMAGNVSEWCVDSYKREYYGEMAGKTNPVLSNASESNSVRGGNFYATSDGRATVRSSVVGSQTRDEVGFRTVFRLRPAPAATPTPTPTPVQSTPTPTPEQAFIGIRESLLPVFQNPNAEIPEPLAGPFAATVAVPFFNSSPQEIRLGFFNPGDGKLMRPFPVILKAGSFDQLTIPKDITVVMVAYAPGAPDAGVVNLGQVNSKSSPLVVVQPNSFNKIVRASGETLETSPKVESEQYYGTSFNPAWNRFLIFNNTGMPVEAKAKRGKDIAFSQLIEPGTGFDVDNITRATDLELFAVYVGANEDKTSNSVVFKNDSKADYRVFVLNPGPESGQQVHVVTRKVPIIAIKQYDVKLGGQIRANYVPLGQKKR